MLGAGARQLTVSERRVAELAAEGRSNPEIAQALFVTRKTVETHLGHIYHKLGVPGRGQLGRALAEQTPTAGRSTSRTLPHREVQGPGSGSSPTRSGWPPA